MIASIQGNRFSGSFEIALSLMKTFKYWYQLTPPANSFYGQTQCTWILHKRINPGSPLFLLDVFLSLEDSRYIACPERHCYVMINNFMMFPTLVIIKVIKAISSKKEWVLKIFWNLALLVIMLWILAKMRWKTGITVLFWRYMDGRCEVYMK